jgi:hypothetical protein
MNVILLPSYASNIMVSVVFHAILAASDIALHYHIAIDDLSERCIGELWLGLAIDDGAHGMMEVLGFHPYQGHR